MTFDLGIDGVLVGHTTDRANGTGCTVVLVPRGVTASVDVRGGAPGNREGDLLSPDSAVNEIHGVLLSGGSAFGLAAADGVVRFLEERGFGHETPFGRVPLVAGAVIYDLGVGRADVRPQAEDGFRAAAAASAAVEEGSVGVGTGATIGKILGQDGWMKGGFAGAGLRLPCGATVVALTVVNAFGDVLAEDGSILAGARSAGLEGGPVGTGAGPGAGAGEGWFLDTQAYIMTLADHPRFAGRIQNTTVSVVVTDARLDKAQCHQLARMAHDGLAWAIRPVHTPVDGDAIYVLSTGEQRGSSFQIGSAAVDVVASSVRRAVRLAEGLHGVPAVRDL